MSRDGELYVGLMSGTSLDGVDVAIVDFGQFPPRILYCATDAYPAELRAALQQLCRTQMTSLDALYTLDARLGDVYADSVERALQAANIDPQQVTALGCHGQTLRHRPDLGYSLENFYNPLIRRIRRLEMPVVCAVNGVAYQRTQILCPSCGGKAKTLADGRAECDECMSVLNLAESTLVTLVGRRTKA